MVTLFPDTPQIFGPSTGARFAVEMGIGILLGLALRRILVEAPRARARRVEARVG
jgi:hypothetical protein